MSDASPGPSSLARSSELGARIVSGCILGLFALLVTLLGGWIFALFWLLAGVIIAFEFLAMVHVRPAKTLAWIAGAGLFACWLVLLIGRSGGIAMAITLVTAALLYRRAETGRDGLWAIAGFLYAAVLMIAMPLLREQAPNGLVTILWIFAVVWATDIAAYFAGRRFGGPKLWAAVSPKKTWSGAIAGTLAGTLAGTVVVFAVSHAMGTPPTFGPTSIGLGSAAASIAGQFGDLGESALKRHGGVKDSGRLIPGHGGVMDRLDALWAVALLTGFGLLGARLVQQ